MRCELSLARVPVACNAPSDSKDARETSEAAFHQSRQALTSEQARVLSFETPVADWSSSVGTLASSGNASEGSSALAVTPDRWTEIDSIPLSTLANVDDMLSYDVYVPELPDWGETRAILISPTLEIWNSAGKS